MKAYHVEFTMMTDEHSLMVIRTLVKAESYSDAFRKAGENNDFAAFEKDFKFDRVALDIKEY